jgi:hypothetical protein
MTEGLDLTRPGPAETLLGRSNLLDLMRTFALIRVVSIHVTGIDALSFVASMPIMFFVAGSLFARSMEKRRGLFVIRDRFRRILPSLAIYATALVVLYASLDLLTRSMWSVPGPDGSIAQLGLYDTARLYLPFISLSSPVGPGLPDDPIFWTWNPLWYIHTHLFLALIGPVLIFTYRRWFKATCAVLGLIWVLDALANDGYTNTQTFMTFFVLGFAFTDGRLLRIPHSTMRWTALVTGVLGLALVPFGTTLNVNQWAPSLLLIGVAWVSGCIGYREQLEAVSNMRFVRPIIEFANRRALTIYIWSLLGVYLSRTLMPVEGNLVHLSLVAIGSLIVTWVFTLAACAAFGWMEDLAARQSPELWPNRRRSAAISQ